MTPKYLASRCAIKGACEAKHDVRGTVHAEGEAGMLVTIVPGF